MELFCCTFNPLFHLDVVDCWLLCLHVGCLMPVSVPWQVVKGLFILWLPVLLLCCFNELHLVVTHTHTRLTALFPGLPRWASTRKVKPIWILLKQETLSGSGISWAICTSLHLAPDRQPHQHPTTLFFTGRMPFLPPNQQHQSAEAI